MNEAEHGRKSCQALSFIGPGNLGAIPYSFIPMCQMGYKYSVVKYFVSVALSR